MSYDSDGNLLTDNLNNIYTWDPNWGSMLSVNSISVTYDALGRPVEENTGSGYVQVLYSPVGKTALMSGSSLSKGFIPLPGGGAAIYTSSGLSYYRHADWLGSARLTSTSGQALYSSLAYAPFGEQYQKTSTVDPSFTGQNSDTLSSLYDFTFREYSMSQGRWMSPDPAGSAAVDPTNPQSWNRYGYVSNSPLMFTDLLGLACCYQYEVNPEPSQDDEFDVLNPVYLLLGREGAYWLTDWGQGNTPCDYIYNNPCGPAGPTGPAANNGQQTGPCGGADCTAVANSMKQVVTVPLTAAENYLTCVGRGAALGALGGTAKAAVTWFFGPPGWAANILGGAAATGSVAAVVCAGY